MKYYIIVFLEDAEIQKPIARLPYNSLATYFSFLPSLLSFGRTVKRELPPHPLFVRTDLE
jgi:hypothetical protein